MNIESLIYLSPGTLPSRWAHSGQIAKMSEAFSKQVPHVEVVTSSDLFSCLTGMNQEFMDWYGLSHPFKLVKIPVRLSKDFDSKDFDDDLLLKFSSLYACLAYNHSIFSRSILLIYTRTIKVANILQRIGVPFLLEWHDFLSQDFSLDLQGSTLLGVVTTLPNLADSYLEQGLDPDKVLVVPNACDLKDFLPHQPKEVARQNLSIPLHKKIVLYSGHLYEYKGISTILEVAHLLPDCQFIFVGGWQDDIERVKQLCHQSGLENVDLIGHVSKSHLAVYLYAADVLVLPTSLKFENLASVSCPLKLFDYMAVKRPIVASALPSIQTILKHEYNALLAEPDNPISFNDLVCQLLRNPSLSEAIAEQAYQDVQQFSWDRRASRVLEFSALRLSSYEKPGAISWRQMIRCLKMTLR